MLDPNQELILEDYKRRINRVFEYIDQNLDSDLSLPRLSEIASFSPFHFHRIFKTLTGETLNEHLSRRKLEKAGADLLHSNIKIAHIAHKYGFSDNASFSKAFKKNFGLSPTEFKRQNPNRHSKIRQLDSKNGQGYPDYEKYICIIINLKNWMKKNARIEVKEMPKMEMAYVSTIGAANLEPAFKKLMKWASPLGLINSSTRMATIYHDSFKFTEAAKVRMSASIILEGGVETSGEIGKTLIEAGKFIVGRFEIAFDEFEKAWTAMFLWMNENGYKKAEGNPFEIYHNNFNDHPEKKAIVDFCIPVL